MKLQDLPFGNRFRLVLDGVIDEDIYTLLKPEGYGINVTSGGLECVASVGFQVYRFFGGTPVVDLGPEPPIMHVQAKSTDRNYHLGFARGNLEDIEAYFQGRQQYGLEVEPIQVIDIQGGYARKRAELLERKRKLEAELEALDQELKS